MNIIYCKRCNIFVAIKINDNYIINKHPNFYETYQYYLCTGCSLYLANFCYIYCKGCNKEIPRRYINHIMKNFFFLKEEDFDEIGKQICKYCDKKYLDYKIIFYPVSITSISYKEI